MSVIDRAKQIVRRHPDIVRAYDTTALFWRTAMQYPLFLCNYVKSLFEKRPRTILVIIMSGIGDIIRSLPMIEKLKKRYPDTRISLLTGIEYVSLVRHDPFIDALLTQNDKDTLQKNEYDLVINLQLCDNSLFVKEIFGKLRYRRLSGSCLKNEGRDGYLADRRVRNWLDTFSREALVMYTHTDEEAARICLPSDWQEKLSALRRRFGIDENRVYVGIHLGANDTLEAKLWYRNYSVAFLKKIVDRLSKNFGIIVTGNSKERQEEEKKELDRLLRDHPEAISLVDRLDLEELILIIKGCDCYISSDTGPLHIAMAVGTPLVGLFGQSSSRKEIGPRRYTKRYSIIQSDRQCSPCGWRISDDCRLRRRALCMEAMPLDTIACQVQRIIKNR